MTVTGLLLAGGRSSRLGRDKATLVVGGQFMWERQIALLRSAGASPIFISTRRSPDWAPADARVVLDAAPSRGPLSGLTAALAATQTSHLLALAIDLPAMTRQHLCKLLSLAGTGAGVVPKQEDRFEPLCAVYPKAALELAQAALARADASLQALVRNLVAQGLVKEYPVTSTESGLYRNVNEPADWPG